MKVAVLIYHKNAEAIYKRSWIEKCIDSIKKQSFKEFSVFELDYGGTGKQYFHDENREIVFKNIAMKNHVDAMNFLIDTAFSRGFDVVMNTNLDDYYHPLRFEKQIRQIRRGDQLIGSNFYYINDTGIFKKMNMSERGDIKLNLSINHNVIAHPVIAMHKSFWTLKYNNLVGFEDLELWKRAIKEGKRFFILPDYLLYYRIHSNQITKKYKLK